MARADTKHYDLKPHADFSQYWLQEAKRQLPDLRGGESTPVYTLTVPSQLYSAALFIYCTNFDAIHSIELSLQYKEDEWSLQRENMAIVEGDGVVWYTDIIHSKGALHG